MTTALFSCTKTRNILLIFCIIIPLSSSGKNTSKIIQNLPVRLCVQTFNTYGPFYGSNLNTRMRAMAQALKNHPCHIIHLQEVWLPYHKQYLSEQFKQLGFAQHYPNNAHKNMGLMSIFHTQPHQVSSLPFQSHGFFFNPFDWARTLFKVRKGFGYATIQWQNQTVHSYNTHLHPISSVLQQQQLQELRNHISQHPKNEKIVLAGDFNLPITHPLIQEFLKQTKLSAAPVTEPTYDSSNPFYWGGGSRTIDHILYKNLIVTDTVINLRSHDSTPLSDHFGVRALFK